jgi:hypothetical protein
VRRSKERKKKAEGKKMKFERGPVGVVKIVGVGQEAVVTKGRIRFDKEYHPHKVILLTLLVHF